MCASGGAVLGQLDEADTVKARFDLGDGKRTAWLAFGGDQGCDGRRLAVGAAVGVERLDLFVVA